MALDEKKRRNMTFRVRDELRNAVEELAKANGRSLSEQVEYYVESSVISEIDLAYKYSTEALSSTLFKFSATKTKELEQGKVLAVSSPYGNREMLTIVGKNHLNNPPDNAVFPWVQEPGGHQHAIEMAQSLIDGIVRGALEGFEATLGPKVVADLQTGFRIGESKISLKLKRAYEDLEMRCKAAENEIERLQYQLDRQRSMLAGPGTLEGEFGLVVGDLAANTAGPAQKHPRMPMPADLPSAETRGGGDLSITALRDLVARFTDREPDLEALRAAGWPRRFDDLPADTRTRLIGDLPAEAPAVYEALMSLDVPRSEVQGALRRLRGVLLGEEEDEEQGGDLHEMEGQKAHRRRRR